MSVLWFVFIFVFAVVFIMIIIADKKNKERKRNLILVIDNTIKASGLVIDNWDNIKLTCQKNNLEYIEGVGNRINRLIQFTIKYSKTLSEEELNLLIDGKYFLGMTEGMLVDSVGNPTKIEEEVMKTKTKKTYVYGNKNSGDVLVFEEGKLVRFKDR